MLVTVSSNMTKVPSDFSGLATMLLVVSWLCSKYFCLCLHQVPSVFCACCSRDQRHGVESCLCGHVLVHDVARILDNTLAVEIFLESEVYTPRSSNRAMASLQNQTACAPKQCRKHLNAFPQAPKPGRSIYVQQLQPINRARVLKGIKMLA